VPVQEPYIDAHSHIWTPDVVHYPLAKGFTVADMQPRSFTAEELLKICRPARVGRPGLGVLDVAERLECRLYAPYSLLAENGWLPPRWAMASWTPRIITFWSLLKTGGPAGELSPSGPGTRLDWLMKG
jgi:hypothetical protein